MRWPSAARWVSVSGEGAGCVWDLGTVAVAVCFGLSERVRGLVFGAGAVAAGSWGFVRYRAWHLRWGATDAEVAAPMPGDELVGSAAFCATRAITIDAPPSDVWPWLVQVGFGRAGFYSYDWADNLGRRSVRVLLPQYQSPLPGDLAAPMAEPADERTAFTVAVAQEPHVLVWAKPDSHLGLAAHRRRCGADSAGDPGQGPLPAGPVPAGDCAADGGRGLPDDATHAPGPGRARRGSRAAESPDVNARLIAPSAAEAGAE